MCESDPGFDLQAAKVITNLRKCFRNQNGPKTAKAPLQILRPPHCEPRRLATASRRCSRPRSGGVAVRLSRFGVVLEHVPPRGICDRISEIDEHGADSASRREVISLICEPLCSHVSLSGSLTCSTRGCYPQFEFIFLFNRHTMQKNVFSAFRPCLFF